MALRREPVDLPFGPRRRWRRPGRFGFSLRHRDRTLLLLVLFAAALAVGEGMRGHDFPTLADV
ncbi:MAG: hypothetical protein IH626_22565, partial [Rhodospirillales bacterium]|nr:hypothetical protein [Rhodospirillales bacterium]